LKEIEFLWTCVHEQQEADKDSCACSNGRSK